MTFFKGDKVRVLDRGTGAVTDVRLVGSVTYYEVSMSQLRDGVPFVLYARERALTLLESNHDARDVIEEWDL